MISAIYRILFVLVGINYIFGDIKENLQYQYVCPTNFTNVGRKCYHFNNGTATWFQAYYTCKDLSNSNLTILSERRDLRQLEQYLFRNRNVLSDSFWIGGFKDWKQKKWIYSDGSPVQFLSLTDIDRDREDNWTCLLIDVHLKRWRGENCMKYKAFICETEPKAVVEFKISDRKIKRRVTIDQCISEVKSLTKKQRKKCQKMLGGRNGVDKQSSETPETVIQKSKAAYPTKPTTVKARSYICPQNYMILGSQCYLFSTEKATWSDAHFICGQINAKLAIIRSKVQDQKLRIFLNGFTENQARWIGGRFNAKTKEWVWAINGKPIKYRAFAKEAFSNRTDNSNWQAIVMDPQYAYQWSYRSEMEKHNYICQAKGRQLKKLIPPRRSAATIEITSHPRYQPRNRTSRRANRNKRY